MFQVPRERSARRVLSVENSAEAEAWQLLARGSAVPRLGTEVCYPGLSHLQHIMFRRKELFMSRRKFPSSPSICFEMSRTIARCSLLCM